MKKVIFLEKANKKHSNKYDYSLLNDEFHSEDKIWIICKDHGKFEQRSTIHLSGRGCTSCAARKNGDAFIEKARLKFEQKAKIVHGEKYNYNKVNYKNAHDKIIIICFLHGEFIQTPNDHLNGYGCASCGINKMKEAQKLTLQQFITKAQNKHEEKYDYSNVNYVNNNTKIIIKCFIHGNFEITPANHLMGKGCSKCGNLTRSEKRKLSKDSFLQKAKERYGNQYDYSNVNYIDYNIPVEIICPNHGKTLQKPKAHLINKKGNLGCAKCGKEAIANFHRNTLEDFINKSNVIHNNTYDYSKSVYVNINTPLIVICKIHNEFLTTPLNHYSNGCSNCFGHHISNPENKWLNHLNIDFKYRQFRIKINGKLFKLDGYDPGTNTVYEFYGDFWHGNPKIFDQNEIQPIMNMTYGYLYERTMKREKILIDNGYNIVSIWENDFYKLMI